MGAEVFAATCPSGYYQTCTKCPANAECNTTVTCKAGYERVVATGTGVISCVKKQPTCKSNEYILAPSNTCSKCPANGKCNGKTLTCNAGFEKIKNGNTGVYSCLETAKKAIESGKLLEEAKESVQANRSAQAQKSCPANATCTRNAAGDIGVKCNSGYALSKDGRKCEKIPCPANATCIRNAAGDIGVRCNSGYALSKDGRKCEKIPCPANATCIRNAAGDIGVRCNSGYALSKDGKKCEKVAPKRCQEGSHESHDWIKKRYDNCTNCVVEKIPAGKCSKVKGEHKHYYCTCDCK